MAVKSNNKNKYSTTVYIGTVNGKKQRKHITADSPTELRQKVRNVKNDIDNGKNVKKRCLALGLINGLMNIKYLQVLEAEQYHSIVLQ